MALRAGSYNAEKPRWQGIIRDDGFARYVCYHWGDQGHPDPQSARECARRALAFIRETGKLPAGWAPYEYGR